MSFVHLHTHSEFSLLDGAIRVNDLIDKAIEYEMPAVAITDHGNMFAAVKFFKDAKVAGIKPIIGEEFYVNPHGMDHKKRETGTPQAGYHLTLLAQNEKGWKNLMKLSTESYVRGFYYKPKIDKEFLQNHAEGIVALSGCLQGQIPTLLRFNKDDEAKKLALELRDMFGPENFYIELMDHGFEDETLVLPKLVQLARDLGIPTVATNDAHYLNKSDAKYHDILLAVGTKQERDDETRKMRFLPNEELYFKSPDEMRRLFSEVPESCDNTLKIAEMIEFEMDIGNLHFPSYRLPAGQTIEEYLRYESEKGMRERYGENIPKEYTDRLEHELKIINDMGFPGYFAICADFTREARKLGVRVGPGRGSGGGSIVAYTMGITDFDPMMYNLLFERFLNPERKSMPDFDIDFADDRREDIIRYVKDKYGQESVAHVISFGTMKAKAAVKDVGRTLGKSFEDMNTLSKLMPDFATIDKALDESKELRDFVEKHDMQEVMDAAKMLEGLPRHTSMHAAGIVITDGPTTEHVPLYKTNKDDITTQFDKNYVEDLGLLKMDFLGLRTLTVLTESLKLIKRDHQQDIRMDRIDYTDQDVFKIFDRGETVGVFQFESSGMKRYLMQLHPDSVEDLIAMNALYRPGPMDNIPTYIRRKHGEEDSDFYHEDFEPILNTTHGILVYQEQIMLLAQKMAGFSLGDADILRRAIGKKKLSVMQEQRAIFVERSIKMGYNKKFAEDMFTIIEKFANYGFNKSHSAAYAILAYQTAYLKRYYPVEFMAANLTSEIGTNDRVRILMDECRRMGIDVRLPSVQKSDWSFLVEENDIRFALGAVKMVGREFIRNLVDERERKGLFKDFYDFCIRMVPFGLNQRLLEFLIFAGALDDFGLDRGILLAAAEQGVKVGQEKSGRDSRQLTFFDIGVMDEEQQYPPMPDAPEMPLSAKLINEDKALGFYLSGHPLDEWNFLLRDLKPMPIEQAKGLAKDSMVITAGMLTGWRPVTTKKGQPMATGVIEDTTSSMPIVIFPKDFAHIGGSYSVGDLVMLRGTITERGEKQILVDHIMPIQELPTHCIRGMNIRLNLTRYDKEEHFADLIRILKNNQGKCNLILHLEDGNGAFTKRVITRKFTPNITSRFYREMEREIGIENIWFDISSPF